MNYHEIDQKILKGLVLDICRQISLSGWRPDYVVGITRGGLIPAVMISQFLEVPMNALKVSLRDGVEDCESNCWMSEDAYDGKNILIVDDINDTGATINWITKDWQGSCDPSGTAWENVWGKNVRFAVVVDNDSSKSVHSMDYVGTRINKAENDTWVIFPWEEWWQ